MNIKEKKPFYKKWWVWLITAAFLGAIINWGTVESTEENVEPPKQQVASVKDSQEKEQSLKENSAKEKEENKVEQVKPKEKENKDEKQEEIIKITALNLHQQYEDNEVAADLKYKDKQLEVTGVISDSESILLEEHTYYWILGALSKILKCFLKKEKKKKIAELSKGQTVTAIGTGGGLIITKVVIKKAQIK
ncbi:hypothetical protein [Sporosarcina sp. Te-1]|uniref:OB-fold protein n=1 Tax=Sporosarcina sp. Te-1 TaxID=2818390 RepID=UPI001A9F199C|nr:hypothetical protein [Sporosarcina sp. Te-1]QTD42706.1 hypothetical protein J3U78_08010 [Sporosarcina sp. Te-1]